MSDYTPTEAHNKPGTISVDLPVAPPLVEPLFTYQQAGDLLGVTERTVWSLVNRGRLPSIRFGRNVRIDPADLRAFIDQSKRGGSEVGDGH